MGHKSRHHRLRQRLRSAYRHARLFSSSSESSSETSTTSSPSPSSGPRALTLGVSGGWQMSFRFSGVRVPYDPEAEPEHQHLREMTLDSMLRQGLRDGEDVEG